MKKIQWYFDYLSPFEDATMNEQDKQKIIDKWIHKNGAADFDLKNEDIILFDAGLFSFEKKKIMLHRVVRHKKLPNGMYQCIFSKKKYPHDDYRAIFWFKELDETIKYLQRMKRMLHQIGYETDYRSKDGKEK